MGFWEAGGRFAIVGTVVLASAALVPGAAAAASDNLKVSQADFQSGTDEGSASGSGSHHVVFSKNGSKGRRFVTRSGISCVPFARTESGIELAGNAWSWWDNAEGTYARGNRPEPNSVLTFRSTGRMRLGHVAVVEQVIGPREVMIDQANWWGPGVRGGVSRDVSVIDVSPDNDWTQVRVAVGHSGEYGSVYPTYGFIYDRPDTPGAASVIQASAKTIAPSTDVASAVEVDTADTEQVAEVPTHRKYGHSRRPSWHAASHRTRHHRANFYHG